VVGWSAEAQLPETAARLSTGWALLGPAVAISVVRAWASRQRICGCAEARAAEVSIVPAVRRSGPRSAAAEARFAGDALAGVAQLGVPRDALGGVATQMASALDRLAIARRRVLPGRGAALRRSPVSVEEPFSPSRSIRVRSGGLRDGCSALAAQLARIVASDRMAPRIHSHVGPWAQTVEEDGQVGAALAGSSRPSEAECCCCRDAAPRRPSGSRNGAAG